MSNIFWISQINLRKSEVIDAFKRLCVSRKVAYDETGPGEQRKYFDRRFLVYWLAEKGTTTLVGGWRNYFCPAIFANISKGKHAQVETVVWDDQNGLMHHSTLKNGQADTVFTLYENQIFESQGIDLKKICQTADIQQSKSNDFNGDIFDYLTAEFPFWDLDEELMEEDFEATHCTQFRVDNDALQALEIGSKADGQMVPWSRLIRL